MTAGSGKHSREPRDRRLHSVFRKDRFVDLHRPLQQAGWLKANAESDPPLRAWTGKGLCRLSRLREGLKALGLIDRRTARKWMEERLGSGFCPPGGDPVSEFWLACLVDLEIYEKAQALALVELVATTEQTVEPAAILHSSGVPPIARSAAMPMHLL